MFSGCFVPNKTTTNKKHTMLRIRNVFALTLHCAYLLKKLVYHLISDVAGYIYIPRPTSI